MSKLKIDRDWCLNAAKREGDSEVGAGSLARDPTVSMTYQVTDAEVDAAQNACVDQGWPLPSRLAMRNALEAAARTRPTQDAEIDQLRKERDAFQRGVIDAVAENERLKAENEKLRRWKALDKPLTAAMEIAASHLAPLRAALKGIEVYSSSHDDARGMAAKALLDTEQKPADATD